MKKFKAITLLAAMSMGATTNLAYAVDIDVYINNYSSKLIKLNVVDSDHFDCQLDGQSGTYNCGTTAGERDLDLPDYLGNQIIKPEMGSLHFKLLQDEASVVGSSLYVAFSEYQADPSDNLRGFSIRSTSSYGDIDHQKFEWFSAYDGIFNSHFDYYEYNVFSYNHYYMEIASNSEYVITQISNGKATINIFDRNIELRSYPSGLVRYGYTAISVKNPYKPSPIPIHGSGYEYTVSINTDLDDNDMKDCRLGYLIDAGRGGVYNWAHPGERLLIFNEKNLYPGNFDNPTFVLYCPFLREDPKKNVTFKVFFGNLESSEITVPVKYNQSGQIRLN